MQRRAEIRQGGRAGLLLAAAVATMVMCAWPQATQAQTRPPQVAAADALRMLALPALAETDRAAALDEISRLLAQPGIGGDLRSVFDLNRLAADLLAGLGREREAAVILADLARLAARNRNTLGVDPVPLWRDAARLFAATGDIAAAIAAEEAVLAAQRDGAELPGTLADTLSRLEALARGMGDDAMAARYAAARAAVHAPGAPDRQGIRGDGTGYTTIEVFYATDRARTRATAPSEIYGHGRGPLETGVAIVTVPDTHRPGQIERPSIWRLEFGANPVRHVTLRSVTPVATDEFFATMQDRMADRDRKEAFVFIHGYNVAFDAAAKRAAQLAYDMNFSGLPVLYSWPSRGSTVGYIPDAAVVQLSARRLSRFLDDLVARSGAETVHIVAHSMGNRALTEALELMALRRGQTLDMPPVFGQIVFAAPDVDSDLFAEMLPTIRPLAQRLTLYSSENDWALAASRRLHGDAPRAGQGGVDTLAAPEIDSIDMSELGEDMLAHGYFAGDRSALVDLVALIWRNLDPGRRCGLAPIAGAAVLTWRYVPGDCPDDDLLAIMGTLQGSGAATPADAQAELARILVDPDRRRAVEPLVMQMMAP